MTRRELLNKAIEITQGNRVEDHGSPENSFLAIARLWSVYTGVPITVTDVAAMMALLKIARIRTGHGNMDNWIDLAGYAACGGELSSEGNPETQEEPAENQMVGASIQKHLEKIVAMEGK